MAWTNLAQEAVSFADGNTGHVYTITAGAPSAGNLDVLSVNSDTTVTTPSGFTLGPTHVGNMGGYLYYRIATGSEGATITITTAGNFITLACFSRWSAGGTITADQNAVGSADGNSGTTSPTATTAALAVTGELSIAAAQMSNLEGAAPTTPVWSTNYTNLTSATSGGTTANDCAAFIGYFNNAGTAAESPNVSWTDADQNRYMLVQTFQAASSGTNAPAGNAPGSGAGEQPVPGVKLAMTIQGH